MYLGLDLSLTGTGICLAVDEEVYFTQRAGSDELRGMDRLMPIIQTIKAVIGDNQIDLAAIENYAFSAKGRVFQLGELGGIVRYVLTEMGIPFIVVGTGQLKKFVAKNGNAKKPEMAVALYKRYGVEFHSDDEADAYGLALVAKAYHTNKFSGKYEAQLLDELHKDPHGIKSADSKKKKKRNDDE